MTLMSLELRAHRALHAESWRGLVRKVGDALDAFAVGRADRAVSTAELRRATHDITRYRRLMRGDLTRQIGGTLTDQPQQQSRRLGRAR